MDQEAIRPLRALVEEAANTVDQAEVLTRRLICATAIWKTLSPPLTDAPWRGLAAVRTVAYLARRTAVEVAEVAREAARVRHFASNLRCTVAMRRCEPSLLSAAKSLRHPCAQAWATALTSEQRDTEMMDVEPIQLSYPLNVSDSHPFSTVSDVSDDEEDEGDETELWEDDLEAVMTAESSLSRTAALALAAGLKACVSVDALCETITALRGEATASLAGRPSTRSDESEESDVPHPLARVLSMRLLRRPSVCCFSPEALDGQAESALELAGAAGAVGGCARRLLREVQRGIALVHAALDGFGVPGEHSNMASEDRSRVDLDLRTISLR